MKIKQLTKVLSELDPNKRIKFQNRDGWGNDTMAINAIIEHGNSYIFIWCCHPKFIKDDLIEGQKLIYYNPNMHGAKLVKDYFPDYKQH